MNRKQLLQLIPENGTDIRNKARYIYRVLEDHLHTMIRDACKSCKINPKTGNMIISRAHICELSGEEEIPDTILRILSKCGMTSYKKGNGSNDIFIIHFQHVKIDIDPNLKQCKNCVNLGKKSWHPFTDFYQDENKKDGYRSYCKQCCNAIAHINKEASNARQRRYYEKNKVKIKRKRLIKES